VNRAVGDGAFLDVVIIADEDVKVGSMTLAEVANALDREWIPTGVRVHYVSAHEIRPGQG
jgi:hypothetical protein